MIQEEIFSYAHFTYLYLFKDTSKGFGMISYEDAHICAIPFEMLGHDNT